MIRTLSDDGTGMVSLFSPTGCAKVDSIAAGTKAKILGNSDIFGYVVVLIRGEIFEVWHDSFRKD